MSARFNEPSAWVMAVWGAHVALLDLVIGRGDAADEIAVAMLSGGLFACPNCRRAYRCGERRSVA